LANATDLQSAATRLGSIAEAGRAGGEPIEIEGNHVRARVARAARAVPGLLADLSSAGISLESIEVHRPTLDDVFLTLTGRSLRDAQETAADSSDRTETDAPAPAALVGSEK